MLGILQTLTPPLAHTVDELAMRGLQHRLPELGLVGTRWREGIQEGLVLTRRVEAAIDTELFHGADEAEAGGRHADRPHQTGLVGIDGVRGAGDVVGTRSTQIGDHGVDPRLRMLGPQATDLVIDVAGLHRAATGTVDAQHDATRPGILEGRPQAADDVVGAGIFLIGNHAAHLDQRGVRTTRRGDAALALPGREQHQCAEQVGKGEQLEEDAPAPRPPLLLHTGQHGLFQQLPALVLALVLGRLPLVSHHTPSSEHRRVTGISQRRSSANSMISRRGASGRKRSSGCAP